MCALAETIGYNPLFVCLALFDIAAALVLWTLLRGRRAEDRVAAEYQPETP